MPRPRADKRACLCNPCQQRRSTLPQPGHHVDGSALDYNTNFFFRGGITRPAVPSAWLGRRQPPREELVTPWAPPSLGSSHSLQDECMQGTCPRGCQLQQGSGGAWATSQLLCSDAWLLHSLFGITLEKHLEGSRLRCTKGLDNAWPGRGPCKAASLSTNSFFLKGH